MNFTEIKFGIMLSLCMLIWITLEFLVGLHTIYIDMHPYSSILFLVVTALFLYFGVKKRKAEIDGAFRYSQAFLSSFNIVIVAVLLSPLVNYLFHTFINPDFFTSMIEKSVSSMLMTEDKALEYFNLKSYIQQGIVGGLISGSFLSLIIAFIHRDRLVSKS
jgi:hypothetical protein